MDAETLTDKIGQNTEPITKRRGNPQNLRPPWPKGTSGNPGGRPQRKRVTDLYEEILDDPKAIALLRKSLIKMLGKGGMATVLQLKEMTDRTEGKVTQPIEADISVNLADAIAAARKRAGK